MNRGKLYEWRWWFDSQGNSCPGVNMLQLVHKDADVCGTTLECGGTCCLVPWHDGACSCCGDVNEPGDCPA